MLRKKTILLYGTYVPADVERVTILIADFVERALIKGHSFITRNGGTAATRSLWPGSSDQLPIDNLVIKDIVDYYKARKPGEKNAIKKRLTTFITPDRTPYVNVGQTLFSCPTRHYEMYTIFFERADIIILIGGNNGVLRLGLLCHFINKPVIAISTFGGAAKEISDSFYDNFETGHYQNIEREDALLLQKKDLTGEELFTVVRKNLRSPLFAKLGFFFKGKMGIWEFLQWWWKEIDHILSLFGKLLLICVVLLVALYLMKGVVDAFMFIFKQVLNVSIKL